MTAEEVSGKDTEVVAAFAKNKYALPATVKKAIINSALNLFFDEYDFSFFNLLKTIIFPTLI
jgi:hypothetical protein